MFNSIGKALIYIGNCLTNGGSTVPSLKKRKELYSPLYVNDNSKHIYIKMIPVNPSDYKIFVNDKYRYVDTWMSGDTYTFNEQWCKRIICRFNDHFGKDNVTVTWEK